MGIIRIKTVMAGLLSLTSVSWLFAQAVVDKDFDDNQNDFEYYWYYYDDNSGVGPNDRPQIAPDLKCSKIDVETTQKERRAFDDASDTWKVNVYKFKTDNNFSKACATMPFTFGDPWEADYCAKGKACAEPYVGIGTMLCAEEKSIDLTGATGIHFFIKSRTNALTAVVKLQTLDIDQYSNKPGDQMEGDEFGYYGFTITIPAGDWTEMTVDFADLALPGTWAHAFDFDITKATKLAWEIKYDKTVTSDTVDIADVSFVGTYKFVSPSMWATVATSLPPSPQGVFATFDRVPYNQAPAPVLSYWYAYNDVEIGGTSSVDATFAEPREDGRLNINFVEGTGSDGVGQGASLVFELGPPIPKDTISVLGFVGIGVNLYDSVKTKYFNADSAGANSVYFEYLTDGDVKFVTLELSDINDVGDATNPARKDSRGDGIVYYRNFPPTSGVWNKVLIPFDSLVVHDSWEGYTAIPLDKTQLAKIQWKVQGAQGTNGQYAVDNICFPGADFKIPELDPNSVVKESYSPVPHSTFGASFSSGSVRVNWNGAAKLAHGKVTLLNTHGAVVASAAATGSTTLSAAKLPAGMYFVRFKGIDAAGKSVVRQAPVTIVK